MKNNLGKNRLTQPIGVLIAVLSIFGFSINPASGQQKVCQDDSVKFFVDNYRGTATWQKSTDGTDWTNLYDAEQDTIMLVADMAFHIRLEILEGSCLPVYSEVMSVELHDPPLVEFDSRDSACVNERDFALTGGIPEGGNYSGPGVFNNRFDPAGAGIGVHEISYTYGDPETTCEAISFSSIEVFPVTGNADAGPDVELITADSIQLQANVPEYGVGTWTVIAGEGGTFTNINDPFAWFYKDSAQLNYELRWTVEGPCGINSDEVKVNFMLLSINPCPGTPIIVDVDGNVYRTVQIGNQCWMAENLRTGTFVTSISTNEEHSDLKDNDIIEKYCFENDTANCTLYGGLYDWNETMSYSDEEGAQGICPDGWHVPTNDEWKLLDNEFKYGDSGLHLKETGDSGFGGQFAGDRHRKGDFYSFGSSGFWWASNTYSYLDIDEGYFRKIAACNNWLEKEHFAKTVGLSVRCIKDN